MRNRGAEAMMSEAMDEPVPEFVRDMARRMGMSGDVTLGEFMDRIRVQAHVVPVEAITAYLDNFPGWDIDLEMEGEVAQDDRIGTVRVAGKKTPVFAHMGITDLFDRTDPPLEQLFATAGKGRKTAIVLQVPPRFFIDADRDGAMRALLIQGGWHFAGDVWHPFLLTQAGPDDLPAQHGRIRAGAPSRGLLRDRGQDPDLLAAARDLQQALRNRMIPDEWKARHKTGDESRGRVFTGPTGWSFFASDAATAAQEELMGSLAVPSTPAPARPDMESAMKGAPRGLVEAVSALAPDEAQAESMLMHLAVITNGFEGLDDTICEDLTAGELDSLIRCSTAAVHAGDLCGGLGEMMGWSFSAVNADPEDDAALVRHGDVIAELEIEGVEEPVPVMFHGAPIDPTEASSDFAFMATRRAAIARFDGKPVLVMPSAINLRAPEGETPLSEGGGVKSLLMMAGYAFDGAAWHPVAFGAPGSNPLENRLSERDLTPTGRGGYTETVMQPTPGAGETTIPPLGFAIMCQQTLDCHHDLGPDVARPRDISDPETQYGLLPWDDDWVIFLDLQQEEIYPRFGGPGDD